MTPTDLPQTSSFLTAVLSTTPGPAALFGRCVTGNGQLVDLLLLEANPAAHRFWPAPNLWTAGQPLTALFPLPAATYQTLLQSLSRDSDTPVWIDLPNQPVRLSFLSVTGSDQVLLGIHLVEQENLHQQIGRYEQMLDHIPVTVLTLSVVRDGSGDIVNFVYRTVNRQWEIDNQLPASAALGRAVLDVFPVLINSVLFARMCDLANTGAPLFMIESFQLNGQTVFYEIKGLRLGADIILSINDVTSYQQAQNELERQRELLRSVLDGSQNQIIAFDCVRDAAGQLVDFRYVLQNEANRITVNRTEEQVIGHTMLEYFPHVIETGLFERYSRVIETGKPDRFEVPYYYDSLAGHYDISAVKRGDGLVLTIQNKTDNWLAEQRLKHQSELLQRVVDNSPVGIIMAEAIRDATGQIIDYHYLLTNAFNARLTGHSVSEMTGRVISELFPGWQSLNLFATFVAVTESGESDRYSFEYNRYGVRGWFEGSFVKQGDGVLFTFLDVSAIKQAEVDQEVLAQQLEGILDNSQTAISMHEAIRDEVGAITDFRTVRGNRLAREIWGPLADIIQSEPFSKVPNPSFEADFARYCRVVETGHPETVEFTYGPQTFLMATGKLGDGVVVSFIDITEVRQSRQKLEMAVQELKRSNESLQQFAYVASHDLQEPLRKIMAFGDMLSDVHRPALGEGGADLVNRMQQSARRMSMLIRDLLDYSRVSTLKDPFSPVDLNVLMADIQTDLDLLIRENKAVVEIDPLPTIPGASVQLQQLFTNLISNAIKFHQKDQPPLVRISYEPVAEEPLPEGLLTGKTYGKIIIQDNGIGFDTQYAERIFQVFQRLHSKTLFAGTGVGLAICRKVVENHNGAIKAGSIPGQGATFTIWLPQ